MKDVVVVEAVRTPIGRRKGSLAEVHSVDLLANAFVALFERAGVDPGVVEQVVGGCVSQVAEQSFNVTRTAWLTAGMPITAPATTVDAQCGSSQQASSLAVSLVASGAVDVAVASGVENMTMVPMGSSSWKGHRPNPKSYYERYELTTQFEAAERIAEKWGISRQDADEFGKLSQDRAAEAIAAGRFDGQTVPVHVPVEGGEARVFSTDEGPRPTTLEGLSELKPVARPDGVHTAGTSSQISDGAAAVLLMTAERAEELGLQPKARIVDHCLVGVDPVMMLTGPIDATGRLLTRNRLAISDLDVIEINEAFASVVLSWQRELKVDLERVNPNGGAIALGHPLGATGVVLLTKVINDMIDRDLQRGLVTMCCGGGLGTGTLVERA
jgi:acetyl-CoA C-acetyltransferase